MTISVLDKDGNPQTLDPPTQTTLAAILAKLSSDPATQTTLAAILAKLIAAPATEAKQDAIVTALGALATAANQSTANTTLATLLTAGTPITGQSLEAGGAGALGWFASIRKKIAAFGTAGTPSADVITVQGISGGTAQPITPSLPTTALSTRVAINAASSGDNTLVAATAGQTIRVHKLFLIASGTVNIKFRDGTAGTDFHPAIPLYAGGGVTLDFDGDPWFVTTAGNALALNLSAAVQVSGVLYYSKS